jgi:UDP-glucuronate 4-epimerase
MPPVIVTGAAGFVGMHVAERLLARGERVLGIDNVNDYYDPHLKRARLARLGALKGFQFAEGDLSDRDWTARTFGSSGADRVVHLAAQAGVRHSIDHPAAYVDANLLGFANVLEGCRALKARHLTYASSSSVYGGNTKVPFATTDVVDHPVSLYAATKKANELMAHVYSHLYALPATGLRFFTVYGPWGRPDMAYYSFTRRIIAGETIPVFNHGQLSRDFTYVDDIVEGVVRVLDRPPVPSVLGGSTVSARIYNIGASSPVQLIDFIRTLEAEIGIPAKLELLPMQPGDVLATYADVSDLERDVDFRPRITLADGLARFVRWYREYHHVR